MIRCGLTIVFLYMVCWASAQQDPVLMRINGKDVLRSEFEYIYNKNNSLAGVEQKTLQEYVDLFVNFKLKVAAAEAAGWIQPVLFVKSWRDIAASWQSPI